MFLGDFSNGFQVKNPTPPAFGRDLSALRQAAPPVWAASASDGRTRSRRKSQAGPMAGQMRGGSGSPENSNGLPFGFRLKATPKGFGTLTKGFDTLKDWAHLCEIFWAATYKTILGLCCGFQGSMAGSSSQSDLPWLRKPSVAFVNPGCI